MLLGLRIGRPHAPLVARMKLLGVLRALFREPPRTRKKLARGLTRQPRGLRHETPHETPHEPLL